MSINNHVMLCGRITKDLELEKTTNNISVLKFTLAINRVYNKDQADFINCIAWKHSAEYLSKYGSKGDLIQVSGEIQTSNYQGKDGNTIYKTEVNCNEVTIRSQKGDNSSEKVETKSELPHKKVYKKEVETFDDDKPF